ncbi:MAG TPA: hypothetical protein VF782_06335 [Allosphingosinicella sp.]|jgi:hypothetical protein
MTANGMRWRTLGCAALLGASIAFPLGLIVGGGGLIVSGDGTTGGNAEGPARPEPSSGEARTVRNVYSPQVRSDPYVIEQQRKVLRALEVSCSQLKRHCAEAEQARRRIEEAEAGR